MAIPDHLRPLLGRVAAATNKRQLKWAPGPGTNDFTVGLQSGYVSISLTSGAVVFKLLNDEGKEIDNGVAYSSVNPADYRMLSNLYEDARRQAMRVNETIDQMLKELGE